MLPTARYNRESEMEYTSLPAGGPIASSLGTTGATMTDQPLRYGERQIAEARLEAVPNPAPDRAYRIDLTCPEFTCLCPRSGFPDFATIYVAYVPDRTIVELKSLKVYLNCFRNYYVFHEAGVNRIRDDLVELVHPRWV